MFLGSIELDYTLRTTFLVAGFNPSNGCIVRQTGWDILNTMVNLRCLQKTILRYL